MGQVVAKTPKLRLTGVPEWHNPKSSRIRVVGMDPEDSAKKKVLRLASSAVTVSIRPHGSGKAVAWLVEYEITQSASSWNKGCIWMTTDDLKTAFAFSNKCDAEWGQKIIDEYGGDVAHQGKYIRYGEYLNIPGPGTGVSGDPNVSIKTDKDIQDAVHLLLLGQSS